MTASVRSGAGPLLLVVAAMLLCVVMNEACCRRLRIRVPVSVAKNASAKSVLPWHAHC